MLIPDDPISRMLGYTDIDSTEQQFGKIIGIHAPKRRGKTLTKIMCINYFLDALPFIKGVICNLKLTMPEPYSSMYVPMKDIKMMGMDEYRKHIIGVDELGHMMDSRMSTSFRNMFVSNLIADTGKFEQIFLYTAQDANQIDRRIRNNVDRIFRPSINFQTGLMTVKVIENYQTYFRIDAFDDWDNYDIEFYFPFRQYYTWYDTKEKIEEYIITFEPSDYLELFLKWFKENKYDEQEILITKATIDLWKETTPVMINKSQISALMEYMLRKTDLPLYSRRTKKK